MFPRLARWLPSALVVLAAGAVSSACTVTPVAVSVGGASVSTASINADLSSLTSSQAMACLYEAQHEGASSSNAVGAGTSGTYSMSVANQVVNEEADNLLADQFATSRGVGNPTPAQLATAKQDLSDILTQQISLAVQESQSSGATSKCETPAGGQLSGAQLLASLPPSVADEQIREQAVEERLLALGADLSNRAVAAYYLANQALFTQDCVSVIVVGSQSQAQQIVAQLNAGASFAALAAADSLDTDNRSQGGSLGCDFLQSQVLQSLDVPSAAVGSPIGPVQDTTSGQWDIYEVTKQVVEPFAQAAPLARQELLFSTANQQRVRDELQRYGRHATVYVNPQYGSWKGLTVVAPAPPPAQYLLASSLGDSTESGVPGQRLQLNGGSG